MIRAVMLLRSGGRVPRAVDLATKLKNLSCVTDAYAVFGRFDVVAFFECKNEAELFDTISEVTKLEGLISSETLMEILAHHESLEYGKNPPFAT
jgi:uncharacterized protein with GYD domain